MLDYIMKLKTLADNLSAIGESVSEKDHILQILGGLGADDSSIVASPTAQKEEIFLLCIASCSLMSSIWNLRIRFLKILYFLLILLQCASLIRINIFVEICIIRLRVNHFSGRNSNGLKWRETSFSATSSMSTLWEIWTQVFGAIIILILSIIKDLPLLKNHLHSISLKEVTVLTVIYICVIFKLKCNLIFNK